MKQRTLAIIKPDATSGRCVGEIIHAIESMFDIVEIKMIHLTKEQAKELYKVHKDKEFYEGQTDFMSSGPSVFMILEGEDAISRYREFMGPTDHRAAPPGTLRYAFGTSVRHNAVHGSDSEESASFEIDFFNSIK